MTERVLVGMMRPEWGAFREKALLGYVLCTCGKALETGLDVREHWQQGHFDKPVYGDVGEAPDSTEIHEDRYLKAVRALRDRFGWRLRLSSNIQNKQIADALREHLPPVDVDGLIEKLRRSSTLHEKSPLFRAIEAIIREFLESDDA